MQRFPIKTGPATKASFAQRYTLDHPGTDIFAPAGAEVVAVESGKIKHRKESKGGKVVYLTTDNKTQYFYGHLDAFADEMKPGSTRDVKAGDVLGYVGTTGSAKGTPPHVHFEMRPRGGAKADPFHDLTRLAEQAAPLVVAPKPKPTRRRPKKRGKSPSFDLGGLGLLALLYFFGRTRA